MLLCFLLVSSVLSASPPINQHPNHQVYDRLRYVTDGANDVTDTVNDILDDDDDDEDVYDDCEEVEQCSIIEAEECGVCHSVFMRECDIDMEYSYTPVKVKECKEDPDCEGEYKRTCYTKYYTECSTKMVYQDMVEDHPVCSVTKKERCTSSGCRKVPVMSCKIEKKTSRKSKPETSCERVPTQICRKDKCAPMVCYERVAMRKEMVPKESCEYKEKRICQETEDATCRTVTRKQCTPLPPGSPCRRQQQTPDSGASFTPDSRQQQASVNRQPKDIANTLNDRLTGLIDTATNRQTDDRQPKDNVVLDAAPTRQTDDRQQQTNRINIDGQAKRPSAVQAKYYSQPSYRSRYHFSLRP